MTPSRLFALVLVLVLDPSRPALAQDDPEPAANAREDVYLTPTDALREVFPPDDAPLLDRADLALTPAERARVEKRLGTRVFEDGFAVHRGRARDGSVAGYAIITEEVGKYRPITFIVAIAPDAKVKEVAVLVYRESHGGDVRRRRFLAQFLGKGRDDPIKQNKDILNVSGATLSVRSVARGVRKVLAVVDELLLGPERRPAVGWQEVARLDAPAPDGAPVRRAGYLMGTVLEATVHAEPAIAAPAIAAAFAEVARLEDLMSTFRPESELSLVNREAARRPVPVSPETFECVAAAIEYARRSGGAFDPTLRADGWKRVALDPAARTIAFRDAPAGLALDLGGIAKGYALDRAAAILRARGASRALLSFGGQVLALDPPPGAPAWIVAVADPRGGPDADAIGFFEVANASVATSSQLERPGHIVDPRTGRPSAAALSATVRAPTALAADGLDTAAFVLGPEAGRALVAREPGGGAESLIVAP